MKIFLTGMPAAGKTTLGKSLAGYLSLPFFDLDTSIENIEKNTINGIFEEKKASYFRKTEARLLRTFIAQNQKFVMATGGGTPCFYHNMALMNKVGITVFLSLPVTSLIAILNKAAIAQRPLLQNCSAITLEKKLKALLAQRKKYYQQAKISMHENEVTVAILAKKLCQSMGV